VQLRDGILKSTGQLDEALQKVDYSSDTE
jgi:hypothetical protein